MTKIKTILLIGRSGRGKSTLANVMTGAENKFKESSKSTSETREIQREEFEDKENNIKYIVIDTPGIGDTKMSDSEVLDIIAEAVYLVKDGVSQVFFVTDGRFDQYEMATYDLLRTIIFDQDITKHTTITRTRFEKFKSKKRCKDDIDLMVEKGGELAKIVGSCQGRVIHVDNPSINVKDKEELKDNEEIRTKSKKILLKHLKESCQGDAYIPPKLQKLSGEIAKYIEQKIEKRKELEEKEKKISLETKKRQEKKANNNQDITIITGGKNDSEGVFQADVENNKTELVTEKGEEEQVKNEIGKLEEYRKWNQKLVIRLRIATLENEIKELKNIKKLKEEIQVADGLIREKVRDHIFSNSNEIAKLTGGDILIKSIFGDNIQFDSHKKDLDIAELQKQKEKLEKKLQEQGDDDQSPEQVEAEIIEKEQELLDSKKQQLNDEEIIEKWQKRGFNFEQAQKWVNVLKSSFNPKHDAPFCAWLRDNKGLSTEKVLNNDSIEQLRIEYDPQNIAHYFQQDFDKWTSGNKEIDEFIQKYQLEATDPWNILEWIPYEQLIVEPKPIGEGGFGKVYKAQWDEGSIKELNSENNRWKRSGTEEVALKTLNNSQNITADFLQEFTYYKLIEKDKESNIVPYYGISQDPQTKNYIMVVKYMKEGNLREYLKKNYRELSFKDKLNKLQSIASGLHSIHKQGLVNQDFHSGNILIDGEKAYITDLGLAKPASETSKEEKIYGVLPYVAPEVLKGETYTQDADVYSFGIVMYEVLTSSPPYYDLSHDESLALKICQGLRPQFQIRIPQLLEDLIKKCWDNDLLQRPSVSELSKLLTNWQVEIRDKKNTEFTQQLQEAEEYNKTLPDEIRFPAYQLHPGAVMHSKLINTKEIFKLLSLTQIEKEIEEIKKSLDSESIELLEKFIEVKKQSMKDKDNKQIRKEGNELEEKLLEDGILSEEEMNKIMQLVELEQKAEAKEESSERGAKEIKTAELVLNLKEGIKDMQEMKNELENQSGVEQITQIEIPPKGNS